MTCPSVSKCKVSGQGSSLTTLTTLPADITYLYLVESPSVAQRTVGGVEHSQVNRVNPLTQLAKLATS